MFYQPDLIVYLVVLLYVIIICLTPSDIGVAFFAYVIQIHADMDEGG